MNKFERTQLETLIKTFESVVRRTIDRRLAQKLRSELLNGEPPSISLGTIRQLAKWCDTKNPLYWDGMHVARKISELLFGCVVDRHRLGV